MIAAHENRPLPTAKEVLSLFSQLLGRPVKVDLGSAPLKPPRVVCSYITDQDVLAMICVFDLSLAAHLGAALSMIPVAVANEAVRNTTFTDSIAENFGEVANVFSSLFNAEGVAHVRYKTYSLALKAVPPDVSALIAHATGRHEFAVSVQGYGAGTLLIARIG